MDDADAVRAWEEPVVIPTYLVGAPDPNPMFLEKRVYQGSSGVVYPHPVVERVYDVRRLRRWRAVVLENRWLRIMILPELGGRVHVAHDKTNGYPFVYHNRVIKPALVGLAGPWISGGIEFNWPQHHRPSTFEPVDVTIERGPDGSATVWCGEIERMTRTRGLHGFTLRPDRAALEVRVRLHNRTDEPQTFLWWANPAVHVHEEYQSVFPPDVHAVMDHGKRAVSDFPIATGTYYKVDYAPGTDISRYHTIPVPTSYMAHHSDYDFVGCYDHRARAGMLHVANHHLVPGKKQWTWGHGDFGQAWDRQLTDEDGPYIELMCGAFTDNQPDFSWLMPGEERIFSQFFLPYKSIGPAHNATADGAVRLDLRGREAALGVHVTRPGRYRVELLRRPPDAHRFRNHKGMDLPAASFLAACPDPAAGGEVLFTRELDLTPEAAHLETVALPGNFQPLEITLRVVSKDGNGERVAIAYTPPPEEKPEMPAPAEAPAAPEEIATAEELFLVGLHLEQYRHATRAPEPYWEEALRRDPLDSRCNTALARRTYRAGDFAGAEACARVAIRGLTRRNPNPYDGEPYHALGQALRMQGRYDEAYDAFYKATWNAAWQNAAHFELARIDARRGRFAEALELLARALDGNANHHRARHLRVALLRRLGRTAEARAEIKAARARDPMPFGALFEEKLLRAKTPDARLPRGTFDRLARGCANTYQEIALDYVHAGLHDEALRLLALVPRPDPMTRYYAGWVETLRGGDGRAAFAAAAAIKPDYCFPHHLECVPALEAAMRAQPEDPRAPYYLGLFLYARRRHDDAAALWERARELDPSFPTVHRNLGLYDYNHRHDGAAALDAYARAFELNPKDARVLFELDQLRRKLNHPPEERLEYLEQYAGLVAERDDLSLERVSLLNVLGRPQAALDALLGRSFHPWEGGEGKATGNYVWALVSLAKQALAAGRCAEAAELVSRARVYPANLGEGKLHGAQENNVLYYLGCARAGLGDEAGARAAWEQAAGGLREPASPLYYNDQPPDMIFYQGLARRKLGREDEATEVFRRLMDYGVTHEPEEVTLDFFAVSLPDFLVFEDDLNLRHRIHCRYMSALGRLGLGDSAGAWADFEAVRAMDAAHAGARIHLEDLDGRAEEGRNA